MENFITEQDIINLVRLCKHDSSIIDILLADIGKLIYGSIVRITDSDSKVTSISFLSDNNLTDESLGNVYLYCSLELSENAVSYTRQVKALSDDVLKDSKIHHRYTCTSYNSYFDYQYTELWLRPEEGFVLHSPQFRHLTGRNKRKTFYDSKQLLEDETDISCMYIIYRHLTNSPEVQIGNEFALTILKMLYANLTEMDIDCVLKHKRIISLPDNKVLYINDGVSTFTDGDKPFNNFKELYVGTSKSNSSKLEVSSLYYVNTPEETEVLHQYFEGLLSETELKDRAYKLVKKRESK